MKSYTLYLVALTLLCCGVVYSAGQIVSDLSERSTLQAELERRETQVDQLAAKRDALADRVARLTGPIIDVELLDEQLRRSLGVGRADEVLLLPPLR